MPKKGKHKRPTVIYSVWDNKTDELVILDGSATACANRIGITEKSFLTLFTLHKKGIRNKYTIESRTLSDDDVYIAR